LEQFAGIFPIENAPFLDHDSLDYLHCMCDSLRSNCELQSSYEHLFLSLYFDQVWEAHQTRGRSIAGCLMPLPQTHLYLTDFSERIEGKCQQKCVNVDFAFWTGQRFLAVQIGEPPGEDRSRDERLLRFWGIECLRMAEDEVSAEAVRDFVDL